MSNRSAERTEFLRDIITTAVEGGVGYWSACSHYQWINDFSSDESKRGLVVAVGSWEEGDREDPYIVLHEMDDEEGYETDPLLVDDEVIARGISAITRGTVSLNERQRKHIGVASRANDAGEIDSDDADVIVQAGLFGEVRYG